ncbi:hypothetical protein HPB52_007826 [Rhipicephalus sanguineus]|uniref:Reverse transcriptase domain-containing protein n=1 Tax=Rhipicephalus sanguineus TaxID=34632 RepID=A0A9D4T592_RHISA|nr:hypothetical protein HPB52_007826 [Rhipicephalus sanguineus]
MEKSFKEVDFLPAKVKAKATALLKDMKLEALCKMVKSCKETGSWQRNVSAFLQLHLKVLTPVDPFVLRNSDTLVQDLKMGLPGANYALSVDIEDLFYSVPHDELFVSVREAIDSYGVVSFQNGCLVTSPSTLAMKMSLKVY